MSKSRSIVALSLLLLACSTGVFILISSNMKKETVEVIEPSEPPADKPVAKQTLTDRAGVAHLLGEISSVQEELVSALDAVGAPYMSAPQRYSVEGTAAQTIEEVVEDIGNMWTGWLLVEGGFVVNHWLAHLRHPLLRNVKIKRLVEVGQCKPQLVGELLSNKIAEVSRHYHNVSDVAARVHRREWGEYDDEEWRKHTTYRPVSRSEESESIFGWKWDIELAVINALYVLAHLDYPPGMDAVAEMARMERPRSCPYPGLLVWCADRSLRHLPLEDLSEAALAALEEYRGLLKGVDISGREVEATRWNAPWDSRDMMMAVSGADTSSFPTISMLELPIHIDEAFTVDEMESILQAWLMLYHAVRGNDQN